MKKKRILVVYIPLIAILVVIIAGFSYSKQSVQKSISFDGEKTQTPILDTWNRIMAKSANKDEINVIVDKKEVKYVNKRAYMSRNMNLMIPLDIVIETFNCAANVYGGEKIVIEKGSSIVWMINRLLKMEQFLCRQIYLQSVLPMIMIGTAKVIQLHLQAKKALNLIYQSVTAI